MSVVGAGSFVAAAEKLGYSQSTITVQMQALERELGQELFSRDEKRAKLTESGRLLKHHADLILEGIRRMREEMKDYVSGDGGLVRIAAVDIAARRLVPFLAEFMMAKPKIKLIIESGSSGGVCQRVASGEMDLALCTTPSARHGLTFEPLFVEEQFALLPADHELAAKPKVRAKEVVRHRLLLTECGCQYRETTNNGFMQSGLLCSPALQLGNVEALKIAVQTGLGIAILPLALASPAPKGTVLRQLEGVRIGMTMGMAYRASAPNSGRTLALVMNEIRSAFSARPAA